jgi:hypothetical protein
VSTVPGSTTQLLLRHHRILRVRARHDAVRHPLALLRGRDTVPRRFDDTRPFRAGSKRQRELIEAGAVIDVDEIHADRFEPYEHLTGARLRCRHVDVLESFRAACLYNANRFHNDEF